MEYEKSLKRKIKIDLEKVYETLEFMLSFKKIDIEYYETLITQLNNISKRCK